MARPSGHDRQKPEQQKNEMNGKGSRPRPFSVSGETFASNWERTFGKKDESSPKQEQPAGATQPKKAD